MSVGYSIQALSSLGFKSLEVPLSNRLAWAAVDLQDAPAVLAHRWHAAKSPRSRTIYAARKIRCSDGEYRVLLMHVAITGERRLDHADRNGLNNRRSNLRKANQAGNSRNRGFLKNNTSGFKGVHFHKPLGKWCAKVGFRGMDFHLGYFSTPELAAAAYDAAVTKLHGEFAVTNESLRKQVD